MKYPDDYINKVICGDCLEVMRNMPDKCVDLVLTDPPYGINKKGIQNDDLNNEDYREWIIEIVNEIERISSCAYFIFHNEDMLFRIADIYKGCRLFASCNNFSIMGRGMPFAWSPIVFKIKDKNFWEGKGRNWFISNTANMKDTPKNIGHPSPKPLDVMKYIVGQFKKGIVFDPFLGSGTTAVACKELNRNFIGVEINKEYCEIAEKRLFNTQGSLF